MRKFEGHICTDKDGSICEFVFEVEDDATEDDIEREARETAFECVNWSYYEIFAEGAQNE